MAAPNHENVEASVLKFLEADAALVAVVPTSRWVLGGADDIATQGFADWLEPRVAFVTGRPSRGAQEARVTIEVGIAVRPGVDLYRREQLANLVGQALANKVITVGDHAGGAPATAQGYIRTFDPAYVDAGRVNGINRGAVSVEGYLTP